MHKVKAADLRDYYRTLEWGSHINLFSVMLYFDETQREMGGKHFRENLLFPGSAMLRGPSEPDHTSLRDLRLRQLLYHTCSARDRKFLMTVPGTCGPTTRYRLLEAGQQFVSAGINDRLVLLDGNTDFRQACIQAEYNRIAAEKKKKQSLLEHRKLITSIRQPRPEVSPLQLLQQVWSSATNTRSYSSSAAMLEPT